MGQVDKNQDVGKISDQSCTISKKKRRRRRRRKRPSPRSKRIQVPVPGSCFLQGQVKAFQHQNDPAVSPSSRPAVKQLRRVIGKSAGVLWGVQLCDYVQTDKLRESE